MKYCLVTQRIEKVLPDVPGPEDEVSGKVRFTPSISYGGSFQVETEDGVATVPASGGYFTFKLIRASGGAITLKDAHAYAA